MRDARTSFLASRVGRYQRRATIRHDVFACLSLRRMQACHIRDYHLKHGLDHDRRLHVAELMHMHNTTERDAFMS